MPAGGAERHRACRRAGHARDPGRPHGAGALRRRAAHPPDDAEGSRRALGSEVARTPFGTSRRSGGLWASGPRHGRPRRADRRGQGREPQGARDRRDQHRCPGCARRQAARLARRAQGRQFAGGVLSDRLHRGRRPGRLCGRGSYRGNGSGGSRRERQAPARRGRGGASPRPRRRTDARGCHRRRSGADRHSRRSCLRTRRRARRQRDPRRQGEARQPGEGRQQTACSATARSATTAKCASTA